MSIHNNCDLSITDIVRLHKYVQEAMKFVPNDSRLRDHYASTMKPIEEFITRCSTEARCPFCREKLFCSDLEEYDYVCVDCDENFYECEVE